MTSMRVTRVLNNNAVIAVDAEGHEIVALGKGLGHGARPGTPLTGDRVDQVFLAGGDAAGARLGEYLADIPFPFIKAAGAIAQHAHDQLGVRVTQALILPLADHLHFAAQRVRDGIELDVPLSWEVAHLYPREVEVATHGVRLARDALGVDLADSESIAVAMHLVNAQFAVEGLARTTRMTEVIAQAFEVIESTFAVTIDPASISAARFVTHMRFLSARVASGRQIAETPGRFVGAISEEYPEAMACAGRVQYLFDLGMSTQLTRDERAYLALHITRLVTDVRTT